MKKKFFMLKKLLIDLQQLLTKKPVYTISERLNEEVLEYPFIFNESEISAGKKQRLISQTDENGIPLIKSYIDVEDDGLHYYPITIGQVGISVYQTYLTTDSEDDKHRFLKFVDWFKNNFTEDETGVFWLTHVPKPEYGVTVPWKSAFTQSRAISILLRGYEITRNKNLLELIKKALTPYTIPFNNGGVSVFFDDGAIYEEYVATEPTMVLDGHIFSLLGVWEILKFAQHLPSDIVEHAQKIFDRGIVGLERKLPEYDLDFWFKFNLCELKNYPEIDPCTVGYMKLVSVQLDLLTRITSSDIFRSYYAKSKKYLSLGNALKAYKIKFDALKKLNRV